jgi:hypothetical protein
LTNLPSGCAIVIISGNKPASVCKWWNLELFGCVGQAKRRLRTGIWGKLRQSSHAQYAESCTLHHIQIRQVRLHELVKTNAAAASSDAETSQGISHIMILPRFLSFFHVCKTACCMILDHLLFKVRSVFG